MLAVEQAVEAVAMVRQVRRTAVKLGDNYVTIECEVTLPSGASDAQIAEAVATGLRIAVAQEAAQQEQVAQLLGAVPEPQPTERQLQAVGRLRARVSNATIAAVYKELGIEGPEPQSKAQASDLIDRLKAIVSGVAPDPAAVEAEPTAEAEEAADLPF